MNIANENSIAVDADTARFLCDLAKSQSPFRVNAITPAIASIAKGKGEFLVLNLARRLINDLDATGELSFGLDGWSAREKTDKFAIQTSYQEFIVDTVIALSQADGPDRELDARIYAALDIFGQGGEAPEYTADRDLVWETAKRINPNIHAAGWMDAGRYNEYYAGAAVGIPPAAPDWSKDVAFATTRKVTAATEPLAASIALLMLLYAQVSADVRAFIKNDDVPLQPDYSNLTPEGWVRQREHEQTIAALVEKALVEPDLPLPDGVL